MKMNPQELVKALNEIGVLYQENPGDNEYKLIYNARVKNIFGEEVIVVQHFK